MRAQEIRAALDRHWTARQERLCCRMEVDYASVKIRKKKMSMPLNRASN
jgi:hypothetical protein